MIVKKRCKVMSLEGVSLCSKEMSLQGERVFCACV